MRENEGLQPRPVVPRKYAGKWVTWSSGGSRIVASGNSLKETLAAAKAAGEADPAYEWIPPANVRLRGKASQSSPTHDTRLTQTRRDLRFASSLREDV